MRLPSELPLLRLIARLQIVQNKCLRIILGKPCDTKIIDLHAEANINFINEYIIDINKAYRHDHTNSLIRNLGNYNINPLTVETEMN